MVVGALYNGDGGKYKGGKVNSDLSLRDKSEFTPLRFSCIMVKKKREEGATMKKLGFGMMRMPLTEHGPKGVLEPC